MQSAFRRPSPLKSTPPLLGAKRYCTIKFGMEASFLISVLLLTAGAIAVILTLYMYR